MLLLLSASNQREFVGFRDYILMALLFDSGIRINEVLKMLAKDINFIHKSIHITSTHSKNGKACTVPIMSPVRPDVTLFLLPNSLKDPIHGRCNLPVCILTQLVDQELSIPVQRENHTAFCESKGWFSMFEIEIEVKSVKSDEQPEFQKVLILANRPYDSIVVHKLDRFALVGRNSSSYRKLRKHLNVRGRMLVKAGERPILSLNLAGCLLPLKRLFLKHVVDD